MTASSVFIEPVPYGDYEIMDQILEDVDESGRYIGDKSMVEN
jgi:hypothetical protein